MRPTIRVEVTKPTRWKDISTGFRVLATKEFMAGYAMDIESLAQASEKILRRHYLAHGGEDKISIVGDSRDYRVVRRPSQKPKIARGFKAFYINYKGTSGRGYTTTAFGTDAGFALRHERENRDAQLAAQLRVLNKGYRQDWTLFPKRHKYLRYPVEGGEQGYRPFYAKPRKMRKGELATHYFEDAKVDVANLFGEQVRKAKGAIRSALDLDSGRARSIHARYRRYIK